MSEYRKHHNEIAVEIVRYLDNKMSDKERYEFERALERDPFLSDALDGLESYTASEIEKDLDAIDVLSGKTKRKLQPAISLPIAVVLLIIVVLAILLGWHQKAQVAEKPLNPVTEPMAKAGSFLSAATEDSISADTLTTLAAEPKLIKKEKKLPVKKAIGTSEKREDVVALPDSEQREGEIKKAKAKKVETVLQETVMSVIQNDTEIEIPATPVAVGSFVHNKTRNDSGIVIMQNKNNIKEEVTQPETKEVNEDEPSAQGINAGASPLGGMELFEQYIEKNLCYPASEQHPRREVVRLKFTVPVSGAPQNFIVIKSPENKDFEKEAIRLVQEGPKWSPAVKNGIPVKDETLLRIVFKSKK